MLQSPLDASPDPRIDYEKAQAAGALSNFDEEVRALQQIGQIHSSEPIILATVLSWECWALYRQNDLDNADSACKRALDLFNNRGDTLGRARVLTRQSLIVAARRPVTPALQKLAMDLQDSAFRYSS